MIFQYVSEVVLFSGYYLVIKPLWKIRYYMVDVIICLVPSLQMIDDMGDPVTEKYFKPGGTIVLR